MGEKYQIKNYNNFPEYKIIDLFPIEKIHYRRGNGYEDLFAEEYTVWQDFFSGDYQPPVGKDIALFHCCSWSKPYDFSFIIHPIREIANKYEDVHRIILSNVGVVPYEYQMNPTFCSYDFPPLTDVSNLTESEKIASRDKIVHVSYKRIYRYLNSKKHIYRQVITLALPVAYGVAHLVGLACKELGIPHINVVTKEIYSHYKNKEYEDSAEIYLEKEILIELDRVLKQHSKNRR